MAIGKSFFIDSVHFKRYYKRTELPKKFSAYIKHFGENEVFLSTHMDFITVDCINDVCTILPYDEYDKLEDIPPYTFYSR